MLMEQPGRSINRININRIKPPRAFSLSAAYLLSGFCSLIYQMVWIRNFSLIFGSTAIAMSIVTAVFFGGLALGSRIFGKISTFSVNPVRLYAILEIIISLYALAFPWVLSSAENLYASLYPFLSANLLLLVLAGASISCVVLLLPTVMMGGTLPLLARHFIREPVLAGRQAGLLYGLNALGAALGCFLAGYVFLHTLGLNKTNILAAAVNLILAIAVFAVSRQTKISNKTQKFSKISQKELKKLKNQKSSVKKFPVKVNKLPVKVNKLPVKVNKLPVKMENNHSKVIILTISCFAISGFVSMAYEVIWLRYLLFFFRDTSFLYAGIIGVFILGIAMGSLLCGWIVTRVKAMLAFFGFLQMGIGLFTIIAIYLPVSWHNTIFEAGERGCANILLVLFSLLIIPSILMGAVFPVVIKIIISETRIAGERIGQAFAVNTIGSILGSLTAGFLFFMIMGLQAALYILFALNMIMAGVLIASERSPSIKHLFFIPVLICLLFPVIIEFSSKGALPERIVAEISRYEEVLEIKEGITGTSWAAKSKLADVVRLVENRVVFSKTNSASFVIQGFIPQLLTVQIPRNVLGLCFGGGLSYYAGRLFPEIKHFDFVDISKKNMDLALKYFPQNKGLKDDQRVNFIVDDVYRFVKYTENRYDLIIMDPNPPILSYRCAALYTKEFYELAQKRLNEKGFFTQVLPLKHMSDTETVNVMKTFSSVFENCLMWWNGFEPVMIGSNRAFQFDVREIRMRINRPEINRPLEKYSKEADYTRLSHFLSGLLLITEDFRKIAAAGIIYTNDLNKLELSSFNNINANNITRIHGNLTPWSDAKNIFYGLSNFDQYTAQLSARREYLMKILYRKYRL